jgi:hypothetical protein
VESPRMVAARSWTAVLPNSCTGSGSVTVELGAPEAVALMAFSWIVAVDWYFGVWTLEYASAATTATTMLTAMVSRRRHSVERNSRNVRGSSLSVR